jgi:hypothetical protein
MCVCVVYFLLYLFINQWPLGWFQFSYSDKCRYEFGYTGSPLYANLHSFGYMSRSGITGSCGSYIFSFLRKPHTDFHSDYTNLYSYQQCKRIFFSLNPYQLSLMFFFLKITILPCVGWSFSVFFIFISFMDNDVEHFLIYIFAICTSENCTIHLSIY